MATLCLERKFCVGLSGCIFLVTSIFLNSLGEGNNRNPWHRCLLSDDIMKPLMGPINNLSRVSCCASLRSERRGVCRSRSLRWQE